MTQMNLFESRFHPARWLRSVLLMCSSGETEAAGLFSLVVMLESRGFDRRPAGFRGDAEMYAVRKPKGWARGGCSHLPQVNSDGVLVAWRERKGKRAPFENEEIGMRVGGNERCGWIWEWIGHAGEPECRGHPRSTSIRREGQRDEVQFLGNEAAPLYRVPSRCQGSMPI